MGVSPKTFQDNCKINQFKSQLKAGKDITTALQNSGYESTSRLYEKLDTHMGMTPGSYRKGVSTLRRGIRYSLGIILHDAQ